MKIITPYLSCLIQAGFQGKDEADELAMAIEQGYSQIYIQTLDGLFKHHILRPGKDGAARYVRVPVTEVPGLKFKKLDPDIQFLPDGKIPMRLLDEVKAFFRAVIEAKGTAVEAMIWILWNQDKGYYLHVPIQVVAHASATYDWAGLPQDSSIIVDIHSHANFGAFFSGTDNNDDGNSIRFSGVIGNNDKPEVTSKWRFNYFGLKIDLEVKDLFVEPPPLGVEVPSAWLDAVQIRSYATNAGGRARMDGTITAKGNWTGPSQVAGLANPKVRHPFHDTEQAALDGMETEGGPVRGKDKGGKAGNGKKKHFGGQETTSGRTINEIEKALDSALTPKIISSNGRQFVDTGNGLVPLKHQTPPQGSADERFGSRVDYIRGAFDIPGITDDMEDRFHDTARRQIQEDLLSDDAEAFLASMEANGGKEEGEGEVDAWAQTLALTSMDTPPEFDEIAVNHGIDVAKAYALIDMASTDLVGADSVLKRSVENLFQLVDEEKKLSLFKELYSLLPKKAVESLAQNGL